MSRYPDGAESGYLYSRSEPHPNAAGTGSMYVYICISPVQCFIKKFTNLSAVLRLEGVGRVLPACRSLWGGCGKTGSHLALE